MLCAHIVFSSDDRKMMERMYAPQKSEFYKSMLFVHLRQVNLLKIISNFTAFIQSLHSLNLLVYFLTLSFFI